MDKDILDSLNPFLPTFGLGKDKVSMDLVTAYQQRLQPQKGTLRIRCGCRLQVIRKTHQATAKNW